MQGTPSISELPVIVQWAAGILTVLTGVILMIWAATYRTTATTTTSVNSFRSARQ